MFVITTITQCCAATAPPLSSLCCCFNTSIAETFDRNLGCPRKSNSSCIGSLFCNNHLLSRISPLLVWLHLRSSVIPSFPR